MSSPSQPPPPIPPSSTDPSVIAPGPSPMDPVIVLVVAIFLWGIAYFLYGQWQKGVASLGTYVVLAVVGVLTCGVGYALFTPVFVLTVLDAYLQAKSLRDGRAIRQWTWFNQVA